MIGMAREVFVAIIIGLSRGVEKSIIIGMTSRVYVASIMGIARGVFVAIIIGMTSVVYIAGILGKAGGHFALSWAWPEVVYSLDHEQGGLCSHYYKHDQ
jgi:hypothetical protein